jgi:Rrf2 family protein
MVVLANSYGTGPLSLGEIAATEGISLAYLEQLIAALRRAGLVTSVRGAYGGYRLTRPPDCVTIGDVVRPLESVALTDCANADGHAACCERRQTCASRLLWERVSASIAATLDSITLADVCSQKDTRLVA